MGLRNHVAIAGVVVAGLKCMEKIGIFQFWITSNSETTPTTWNSETKQLTFFHAVSSVGSKGSRAEQKGWPSAAAKIIFLTGIKVQLSQCIHLSPSTCITMNVPRLLLLIFLTRPSKGESESISPIPIRISTHIQYKHICVDTREPSTKLLQFHANLPMLAMYLSARTIYKVVLISILLRQSCSYKSYTFLITLLITASWSYVFSST